MLLTRFVFFFFQAEDGIRDLTVTGVQTCALPILHGLVRAPHVDHLHPDSGIALAAAADGEELTRQCFGDRVAWVPWRRPGFQLGLDIARSEEHTSELQSQSNLVCRLLLEKKKRTT